MPKKRFSPEQIIATLRQIQAHLTQGKSIRRFEQKRELIGPILKVA